ncbi:MAG: tyrosine-type recombinase/integrase [Phycisphaerales bacterium JB038]
MIIKITSDILKDPPPIPEGKKSLLLCDEHLKGFHARLTRTGIYFSVRCFDLRHRERTFSLGRLGDVTLSQARKKAQQIKGQYALGNDPAAERQRQRSIPKLADFLQDRVMPHVRETLRGTVTYESFKRRLSDALGHKLLDEVTPEDVAAFRGRLVREGLSNASVNRHLAFTRSAFNRAREWSVYDGPNPAASPGMLPEQGRDRYLTAAQVQDLVAALGKDHDQIAAAALGLLMLTGARKGEVLNARWEHLDLARGLLLVPRAKSGRPHRIPLSPSAVVLLETQRDRLGATDSYIFPGHKQGKPLSDLRGIWTRVKEAAALPADLRIHDLRHSFASALVNRGVPLHEVAVILGHSQLSTTQRYAHHAPDRLIKTAGIAAEAWNLATPAPATTQETAA